MMLDFETIGISCLRRKGIIWETIILRSDSRTEVHRGSRCSVAALCLIYASSYCFYFTVDTFNLLSLPSPHRLLRFNPSNIMS